MIQHEIHDEMKDSYIDYAMSVIVGRALPDVRDGLEACTQKNSLRNERDWVLHRISHTKNPRVSSVK